jgi:uncharacterized protein (TIGR02117 family)
MITLARRVLWGLAGLLLLLLAATWLTARPGNPGLWPRKPGEPVIDIYAINHGYHSGIAISRGQLADVAGRQGNAALIAVVQRFAVFPWIEFGWGDEGFYRSVPDVASLTFVLALRALLLPGNPSVMHVVGLSEPPRGVFPFAEIVQIGLTPDGFARLVDRLDASFARAGNPPLPEEAGPGLYGPSLFFRAVDSFHLFNVCNHWTANLLSAAGLPVAPIPATLPQGLLLDLRWRSGVIALLPAVRQSQPHDRSQ